MKIKNLLLVCSLFLAGGVVATGAEQANNVKAETKTYEKVTKTLSDWSGEYLIVYGTGKLIFDGSRTTLDGTKNTQSITISGDNKIAADPEYSFTIEAYDSGWSIKSKSGYYIGQTKNDNGLKSSTSTKYNNTITFNNGDINITSGGAYLRYNANSGQERFRYFKSTTYTNQKAIQLYKAQETTGGEPEAKAYTVTLNANGSVSNNVTSNVLPENGVYTYTLPSCSFEAPAKKVFDSWNTNANGTGTSYAAGDQATLTSESTTFYAQWKDDGKNYINVSFDANGGSFAEDQVTTVEVANGEVLSGAPTATYAGYTFVGWSTEDGELVDLNEAVTWEDDVTLYAQWEVFVQKEFELVTDASQLKVGDEIVVANTDNSVAISTTQNGNNRGQTEVIISDSCLTFDSNSSVQIFTLENGTKNGSYSFFTGEGYIYAASSGSNYLRTETKLSDNSSWTIEIDSESEHYDATLLAQGTNTRNYLQYNLSSKLFSCYASDKPQKSIQLYRYNADENVPVVPENAEKFMESEVESALSLSYLYDGENYSNFSNLALLLRLRFDFKAYGEGVEESGLVITRSKENAEGFVAGSENVTYFEDKNQDGEYVIRVEAGKDVASVLDTLLYVCGYVVVDGNTYVTTVRHVSFKSMLELYANSDHESAPVAAAALAYWTNAQ